jgi:16S rRNA (guanine527-N7)-methyltransferase
MSSKIISEEMSLAGIETEEEEAKKLSIYLDELKKWNKKYNLIGLKDDLEIIRRLFVSSATFLQILPEEKNISIIDIGSGAGIPGIPIKILCPDINVTCIDSNRKKINFVKHISRLLHLNINSISSRAEDIPKEGEGFDCAVAHSVGTIFLLIKLSFPLLKDGGVLIMRKGEELEEELAEANLLPQKYSIFDRIKVSPKGEEDYTLISIQKCST